jgi:CBS-domain-containing membrane protein
MAALFEKSLLELTAGDLMSRAILRIPEHMTVRDAVRILLRKRMGAAPVIDQEGQCIGVFSVTDFLPCAGGEESAAASAARPACSFVKRRPLPDQAEVMVCTLSPGLCSLQVRGTSRKGDVLLICGQPSCVHAGGQIVSLEALPTESVRSFMTADTVLVERSTPIHQIAQRMNPARSHRVIVVLEDHKPVGMVSGTDLLAALASAVGANRAATEEAPEDLLAPRS